MFINLYSTLIISFEDFNGALLKFNHPNYLSVIVMNR